MIGGFVLINVTRHELHGGANYTTFTSVEAAEALRVSVEQKQGASGTPDRFLVAALKTPFEPLLHQVVCHQYMAALRRMFPTPPSRFRPWKRRWYQQAQVEVAAALEEIAQFNRELLKSSREEG